MTTDKEMQDFLNSEISIEPGQWLIQQYENGVPIEEVKKTLAEWHKDKKDGKDLIAISSVIVEEFYKQWDKEGNKK